ncbi:ATP-binding protein (plasmid) [Fructilactobacillus ixorae]|uniref:ATP-binding protein n=1 Tax=Fructilactobacillus ixorae TaxID=1750535 RepID=A0ABY5C6G4_9LACO|nr:ATP-binding protein [Fructilactobacillus ixorae]USS93977.1 ATP-binding protein [Fructilactobacillus ixorae]
MGSFKAIEFPLLNKVHKLPDKCSRCGNQLIQVGDKEPFCQYCQLKSIKEKDSKIINDYQKSKRKRFTTEVLKRDSIIEDQALLNASFDNYDASVSQEATENLDKAKRLAIQYSKLDSPFNTVLSGVAGRGKSHLSLSMLKYINKHAKEPVSCLYVDIAEMLQRIKASFNYREANKYSEDNMTRLCGNADFLVIDDLGSEATFKQKDEEATNFSQRLLFNIMQRRQDKSTIITTNLSSSQMGSIYNPKIVSRLFKNLNGHVIKFTEKTPDQRRKDNLF